MMRIFPLFALALALTASPLYAAGEWPRFLGPGIPGQSDVTGLPLQWSETDHVKWQTEIPGEGWSSPVVLGNQIWMATSLDEGKSLRGICVDRSTGKILHDVEIFHLTANEGKHAVNSHASPTPAIENGRVYFSFGMYGSACLDTATGKPIWKNTELKHDHDKNGPGSSPILYKNLYILNCDGTELRYVAALDKLTGKLVWKTPRSNVINYAAERKKAYSTPLIINVDGQDQLISPGAYRVSSYEPLTGKEIWSADINGFSNAAMPTYAHGLVYVCSGFPKAELVAIRPNGTGVVTSTHILWTQKKSMPFKPTPLVAGDQLYIVQDDSSLVTCLDARSGTPVWSERIGGAYSATPLYVDGRIYFFSSQGDITVLKPDTKLNVLAKFKFGDGFMASPAVVDKTIYLRSKTRLYCIE